MKKALIPLLVFLSMVFTASALDMCTDTRQINSNCTMITPYLICPTYTYQIFDINGTEVRSGNLTNITEDIYSFDFTEPEGDYIVRLCDGTTREVRVTQEDDGKMIIGVLILIPMLLGIVFLIFGASLSSEDHTALRIILSLFSIPSFIASLHFGMVGIVEFYDMPEMELLIGDTTYWMGVVFFVLVSYFMIYAIYKLFHKAAQKKRERLEY